MYQLLSICFRFVDLYDCAVNNKKVQNLSSNVPLITPPFLLVELLHFRHP